MKTQCIRYLLAISLVSLCQVAAQTHPDFRKSTWGMTQAQVMATEPERPAEVSQSSGETVLKYDAPGAPELEGRLIYFFAENKLVRAKYISSAHHSDLNDFIADYRAAEPALEKYGKPSSEKAVWEDDSLQQEKLSYLDQDRALASDILPSDQYAGLSVSLGYLKLFTVRANSRTKLVHALTGGDHRITHQIEYRSIELAPFEDKVRQQSAGK